MKSVFIFVTALLAVNNVCGQDMKITVLDSSSDPLPYSFVLLNNVGIGVADPEGNFLLPKKKLNAGDTLKVTFIGMESVFVVCDKSFLTADSHIFYLKDEKSFDVDDIVVRPTPNNSVKLFRKYASLGRDMYYNCIVNTEYSLSVKHPDSPAVNISGQLTARNEVYSREFEFREFGHLHHPAKTTPVIEDPDIQHILNRSVRLSVSYLYLGLTGARQRAIGDWKPFFYYLGMEEGSRVFRISFPKNEHGMAYQIILYIDKKTKQAVHMNFECYDEGSNNLLSIDTGMVEYINKRPRRQPILIPRDFRSTFTYPDNTVVSLNLSALRVKGAE